MRISVEINGRPHEGDVDPRALLSDFIRHSAGLTGTKVGCEQGVCGACTVQLDGEPVRSCLMLAVQANGRSLTTIEGLATEGGLHPLQRAFHEAHALQCGFCTPGFLMSMEAFLREQPNASDEELREALAGNLCRCTGYLGIIEAVKNARGSDPLSGRDLGLNEIERVGFAGLGAMGAGIARRLLYAGYDVVGWNRTREKAEPLIEAGMGWADTPRELAESVDVLFTMLTNTAAIEATASGPDGVLAGLGEGKVWADISTISPDASVALAERVRETGASFLDCPVSGSPATLAAGQMSVMVGGDREAFDRIEQVLHAIGPKVTYIGPNGQAILTKVAINLALVVSVTALAEGIALVEKAGVDRAAVVDAVLKSVIASPVVGYRAPLLVDDTDVFADVELQQKDLVLAQELARRLGMAVPTCAATSEMLNAARSSARADRDFVVSVHETYRRMGGME